MQDKEFAAILQDEPQQPLALVPLTEEEQVSLHFSAFPDASCSDHKKLISSRVVKTSPLIDACFQTVPLSHSNTSVRWSL